jgi:hypothetical protein
MNRKVEWFVLDKRHLCEGEVDIRWMSTVTRVKDLACVMVCEAGIWRSAVSTLKQISPQVDDAIDRLPATGSTSHHLCSRIMMAA